MYIHIHMHICYIYTHVHLSVHTRYDISKIICKGRYNLSAHVSVPRSMVPILLSDM